ncbi:LAMI_0F06304g1_1 [Lachancea mirantina]|uniref:LAMI_0F06304g1_1 n=1 Tax=Lachancea mirantina TaxID=1230905 RepID=A0A1G4JYW7_9SACH|nr:LAMI_0F06304g1_1 [Lachancea mirantina]
MSYDWLNVPGIVINNEDSNLGAQPPPMVSFNFGEREHTSNANNAYNNQPKLQHGIRTNSGSSVSADNINRYPETLLSTQPGHERRSASETELSKYAETQEDLQVPLSLSRSQLTKEEIRTYLRWYNYIASRKGSKLISLEDVFRFLSNFPLNEIIKTRIEHIFKSCRGALNIGRFFAVLRLVSRALTKGVLPTRSMLRESAPIPKPKSILAQGNNEVYEEVDETPRGEKPEIDFDSFAALLLTGQKKKRLRRRIINYDKRSKSVRFSDKLVTFQDEMVKPEFVANHEAAVNGEDEGHDDDPSEGAPLDLSLPMDQLLKKIASRKKKNDALVEKLPSEQEPETQEEREVLEGMKESLNHFHQIQNVDNVSRSGITAQINNAQATANHLNVNQTLLEPLKPTATGSANHLFRSNSQPANVQQKQFPLQEQSGQVPVVPNTIEPLRPTATGSANYMMRRHQNLPPPQSLPAGNATTNVHNLFLSPDSNYVSSPRLGEPAGHSGTASDYFQNLLSHSPSPNNSSASLRPENYGISSQANGSSLRPPPPHPFHQRPMSVSPQPTPGGYPNFFQQMSASYTNMPVFQHQDMSPSPVHQISPAPPLHSQQGNILGDLRALKEQVDQLQNNYNR